MSEVTHLEGKLRMIPEGDSELFFLTRTEDKHMPFATPYHLVGNHDLLLDAPLGVEIRVAVKNLTQHPDAPEAMQARFLDWEEV